MKDKVESGFGMNDEKKYFYALNENRFKFGLYRTSISELKRAYPKLKYVNRNWKITYVP